MAAEKNFEEKLKRWLESEGIYGLGTPEQNIRTPLCGYWEKRWGGGQYTKSGLPDMHIVVNGVSIEAELKAPEGRLSVLQKRNLKQIGDANCIAVVIHPKEFDNFKQLIQMIKSQPNQFIQFVTQSGLENGWKYNI